MQNENLLVNSKTDILEFKRKHNLLVEKGSIKANVSNIKSLSNDVINNLRCGDVVLKEDASGKHAYLVSFKSDTGLCLTYCDASCVETQSYDKVGNNWQYNSQDLTFIAEPRIENIVDKDGHKRFVEGNITLNEFSGVSQTYGKWSLSGSHLLIVIGVDIANGTELTGGIFTVINVPEWLRNKIVALYATTIVDNKSFRAYADNYSSQDFGVSLQKSSTSLYLYSSSFTATADRHCRISYDLLIDNE